MTPNSPVFPTLQENAAFCWFHRERGLTIGDVTVFGSVSCDPRPGGVAGDARISFHDHRTGVTTTQTLDRFAPPDDHNAPAVCYMGEGVVLAMWQDHGADQFVRRQSFHTSGVPLTPATLVDVRAAATYSNVFRLPDTTTVLDFHRGANWNPNYVISQDGGANFAYGGRLIHWPRPQPTDPKYTGMSGGRPYVIYCQSGRRIHFAAVEDHPSVYDNSVYHGYIEDMTVFDSQGRRLGPLPADGALPDYGFADLTKVFEGGSDAVAWVSDISAAADGTVTIVFSVRRRAPPGEPQKDPYADDLRYHYAHFNGQAWSEFEMAFAGARLYPGEDHYSGLAALHPSDPKKVAFSTNHCPVSNAPLRGAAAGRARYEIFLGEVDPTARSVRFHPVTVNSSEDNLRPFFTVGHEGGECVLFWMVGNYGSYSHFDTRVVGFPLTQEAGARICATAYRPVADDLGERPVMTDDGIDTLERHLTGCEVFLEYGSGGSTLFAGGLGVREIYSVESDAKWAHRVQERFDRRFGSKGLKLRTIHADIGPTGEWGFPTDPAHAAKWPNYALAPWRLLAARQRSPQVVLIDGRFRVACFLATLAFAEPGTIILFDDYVERPHYHLVETYCPRAAPHGRMGVFRVPETHDRRGALFDLVPHLTRPE